MDPATMHYEFCIEYLGEQNPPETIHGIGKVWEWRQGWVW